jgi:FkbM family methyltransferase
MSSRLLYDLNHARLWQRSVPLWDCSVRATSLDRLLFLALHRAGWMGTEEVTVLRRLVRPGMQVLDVGANVGLYSLLLARLVGERGRVYSFEPEPQLCATLRENCASNGITNVVSFEYAAGPSNTRERFQRAIFNSGNNRLDRGPSHAATLEVTVVRIDDILPVEKIDFVKIDVQGHELGALAGMDRLLSSNPDLRAFFEFWPDGLQRAGNSPEALLDFFRERDFLLYETSGAHLRPARDPARLLAAMSGSRYTNLLASRGAIDV